jgi:hypothetical protein
MLAAPTGPNTTQVSRPEPRTATPEFFVEATQRGGSLSIAFTPTIAGSYSICVAGAIAAELRVTEACVFGVGFGSPCSLPVCLESSTQYDADICSQEIAAYCATHEQDGGCALLVARFAAQIHSHYELSVITEGAVEADVKVQAAGCGCSCAVDLSEIEVIAAGRNGDRATVMLKTTGLTRAAEVCAPAPRDYAVIAVVDVFAMPSDLAALFLDGPASPCRAEVCQTESFMSEACTILISDYCASTPDDACALIEFVYEREVGAERALGVRKVGLSPVARTFFVPASCTCDAGCRETDNLVVDAVVDKEGVSVRFVPDVVGVWRLCADATPVAIVRATASTQQCPFATSSAPCMSEACSADTSSEACMQVLAEYCTFNAAKDAGCSLIVPKFVRSTGLDSFSLTTADVASSSLAPQVRFLATVDGCACGVAACEHSDIYAVGTSYNVAGRVLSVDFDARGFGRGIQVCVTGADLTERLIAVVDVSAQDCLFRTNGTSPCTFDVCVADPFGPECLHAMIHYCATAADEACAFLRPLYTVKANEKLVLPALGASAVEFYPESCECDSAALMPECDLGPAKNGLSVLLDVGAEQVTFTAMRPGGVRLCTKDATLAIVRVTVDGCPFDETASSPCYSEACEGGADSDACLQYTAQYCALHASLDRACSLFSLRFARFVGEIGEVSYHDATLKPGEMTANFIDVDADCAGTAEGTSVEVVSVSFKEQIATVEFVPQTIGRYKLCIAGVDAGVEVDATASDEGSLFSIDMGAPCAELCSEDPSSEECMQGIAEYCITQPDDGGCAFVLPVFERSSRQLSTINFRGSGKLTFPSAASGCPSPTAPQFIVSNEEVKAHGEVTVSFTVGVEGRYAVCEGEQKLAEIIVSGSSCLFADSDLSSPCRSDACSDMDGSGIVSANCLSVASEYCRMFPADKGCSYFVPFFYSIVDEEQEALLFIDPEGQQVNSIAQGLTFATSCDGTGVSESTEVAMDVVEVALDGNALRVVFIPRNAFWRDAKLCLQGEHIATVTVASKECSFRLSGDESPCAHPYCYGPEADMNLCSQVAMEYCAHTVDDTACQFYVPLYELAIHTPTELSFHVSAKISSSAQLRFVADECECGVVCSYEELLPSRTANTPTGDNVIVDGFEAVSASQELTTSVIAKTLGEFKLCVAPNDGAQSGNDFTLFVAKVRVSGIDCVFDLSSAPCLSDACAFEPTSDACLQVVAEHCSVQPDDLACAQFIPAFVRNVKEPVTFAVHVLGVEQGESVFFAPAECACGECEDGNIEVLEATINEFAVSVVAQAAVVRVDVKLCVGSRAFASAMVDFVNDPCVFDATGARSPCTAAACADPHSEECVLLAAEYCAAHGSTDEGCALFVPAFTIPVGQSTSVEFMASGVLMARNGWPYYPTDGVA